MVMPVRIRSGALSIMTRGTFGIGAQLSNMSIVFVVIGVDQMGLLVPYFAYYIIIPGMTVVRT
jgi:hypothetical protein